MSDAKQIMHQQHNWGQVFFFGGGGGCWVLEGYPENVKV